MPIRFTQRILEHLAHEHYRPGPASAIAKDMRIDQEDRDAFDEAIQRLAQQGTLLIDSNDVVRLPSYSNLPGGADDITGKLRLNPRGFGFIIPDTPVREGDLFVPPGSAGGAISGDRVRAKVLRAAGRGREGAGRSPFVGRIVEVLERGQEHFVGVLIKQERNWLVEPDGRSLRDPVIIRDPHAKNAKAGDKVVIELLHYPEDDYLAEGVIVQVLGEAGRPDVETQAVIAAHGLRTEFPLLAVEQARHASRTFDAQAANLAKSEREDVTGEFIFTIDPPDAKDFDDAISITHDKASDEWTLGVHIADVSHFIEAGTDLDQEAKARGTSVYLPRLVIPMLPEVLSNGVCSLQEGVVRFTKSAFITFDGRGKVLHQRAAATVIKSAKRLTYLEAQALIDGDVNEARKHARAEANYSDELIDALGRCDRLARILQKRRMRDGMIVLALPEVELVFDEDGHVIDAVPEDNAFTHKIIEMFMVEANEAIARLFEDLGVAILRRIHPEPAHGDIAELRLFARAAHQDVPDEPSRHDLQRLLEATKDTPAARAIHFAVLRTLSKASYSPALVGHFALASDHYAHFTSPIRRYPDLSVHRALSAYLDATDNGRNAPGGKKRRALGRQLAQDTRVPDEAALLDLGRHCSETEVEAELAERELREFLVMQFLHENHLGDEFPGVITGVISSGVFVSIDRFLVEGKIAIKDLSGASRAVATGGRLERTAESRADRWIVNESLGRVTAQRSGATLMVGDIVTVQIVAVDLASRHLDLIITGFPQRSAQPAPSRDGKARRDSAHDQDWRRSKSGGKRGKVKAKGKRSGFKQGRRGRKSR